jgi:hypothetical protein
MPENVTVKFKPNSDNRANDGVRVSIKQGPTGDPVHIKIKSNS